MLLDEHYRRGIQQDCRRCTKPNSEGLREAWGCDAPAPEPWELIDCVACGAMRSTDGKTSVDADPDCPECGGTGVNEIRTCPWRMVGWRERFVVEAVVRAEAGDRPFARCGWAEMPATYHDAFNLVACERAQIQDEQQERARREAKG